MENKRKWNRIVYICMIFILSSGLIFYPTAYTQVYAVEEEGDVVETEDYPSLNDSEEKDEKENSKDESKEKEDDKKEEPKQQSEDKDNDDNKKDETEQSEESA